VSRADLPIGLQAAQAAHAAFEFSKTHPESTKTWMQDSNFIVLVTVPDEFSLLMLNDSALHRGLKTVVNYEPDVNDEATAIVIAPGDEARRLCSALPLLGREVAMSG